ncbi:RNA-binding protein NOB1-like protein, partial [Euroglyphus maynei]
DFGEIIYTLDDVINEIKDEKTRQSLQILPYELKHREPTDEDVKFVAYFAKKTGDFNQLSTTDIRLIALTVRLEKEINNDGLHIRQARQYIMRCHACSRINPSTAIKFCKYCGNFRTLKRVAITINNDGTVKMHINFKRPIRIRGTKYSLPMPRGGKHANNPILCEDQRIPQQRKSKTAVEEKK